MAERISCRCKASQNTNWPLTSLNSVIQCLWVRIFAMNIRQNVRLVCHSWIGLATWLTHTVLLKHRLTTQFSSAIIVTPPYLSALRSQEIQTAAAWLMTKWHFLRTSDGAWCTVLPQRMLSVCEGRFGKIQSKYFPTVVFIQWKKKAIKWWVGFILRRQFAANLIYGSWVTQEKTNINTSRCKLSWFGHVCRHDTLSKIILQVTVDGSSRRRGRPRKSCKDNI